MVYIAGSSGGEIAGKAGVPGVSETRAEYQALDVFEFEKSLAMVSIVKII